MPVTPIYGLPYPALTDPPNGAAQQQDLAEAVENSLSDADSKMSTIGLFGVNFSTGNPSSAGAWVDWAGTISIPNPGRAVSIAGWANMKFANSAGTTDSRLRVAISVDGGTSWVTGPEIIGSHGTTHGIQCAVAASEYRATTPTGSVNVKVQIYCNHTSTTVGPGQLTALIVP